MRLGENSVHKINIIALIAAAAKAGYTGKAFENAVRDRANEISSRISQGQPIGKPHHVEAVEISAFVTVGYELDSLVCGAVAQPLGFSLVTLQTQARNARNRAQQP